METTIAVRDRRQLDSIDRSQTDKAPAVWALAGEGWTIKAIAQRLEASEQTVAAVLHSEPARFDAIKSGSIERRRERWLHIEAAGQEQILTWMERAAGLSKKKELTEHDIKVLRVCSRVGEWLGRLSSSAMERAQLLAGFPTAIEGRVGGLADVAQMSDDDMIARAVELDRQRDAEGLAPRWVGDLPARLLEKWQRQSSPATAHADEAGRPAVVAEKLPPTD